MTGEPATPPPRPGFFQPRRNTVHRFIAYLTVLSILPLLGLGLASFEIARSALQAEATRHLEQLLRERKRFIDLQTEQIEDLIANVSGVEAITTGLAQPYDPADDYTRLLMQARIGYILNGYVNIKGLVSIDLFSRAGAHYHVGDTLDVARVRRGLLEELRRQAEASARPVHWVGIIDNVNGSSKHTRVIAAAKALRVFHPETSEQQPLGVLVVNYGVDALKEQFGALGAEEAIALALVDDAGRVVTHTDARRIGSTLEPALLRFLTGDGGHFRWSDGDAELLVSHLRSEPSGWRLVGFVPQAAIDARAATIGQATAVVLLMCLAIASLAALSYSHDVVAPIRRLTERFKQWQAARTLSPEPLPVHGEDDVAELTRWFNAFVDGLRERERAQQLAQEERRARLTAEAANEAKTLFLAKMSHELRTPLNAVLGYAQILLRDERLDERQRRGLKTIHSSGAHLLTLINDILDLAKIEAQKLALQPQAMDLAAFLQVIVDTLRVRAEERGLLFVFEAAPDLPRTVRADDKRLRQVLLNLLSNAVKFTERGRVTLRVSALPPPDGASCRLRFDVEDTGPGIAEHQLQECFEPFQQVGDAQRHAEGTGLGLAISRQLVRLMGSEIHVDSALGLGSRFWFELELPIVRDTGSVPLAHARPIVGYEGARRKILLVDDVSENRALLAHFLEPLGFDTLEAVDGVQAIEQVRAQHPDLVLMDVVMPRMDGLQATRELRRHAEFARLPIIAASAISANTDASKCHAAGADVFLPKPLDFERLLDEIGALLRLSWTFGPALAES